MNDNQITAIIPAYNAEKFLSQAIDSVLAQTRQVKRIIVVDDCSSDQTAEIAQRYSQVNYLKTPTNGGHATARNIAISEVDTELIGWLDADDTWNTNHLEKVAGLLDEFKEAAVCCSPVNLFGSKTGIFKCLETNGSPINALDDCYRQTCVPAMSAVTRTSAVREIGGFDTSYRVAPDYDFWLRMSLKFPFVSYPQPTANYRWHENQVSAQSPGRMISIRQLESFYRARHAFCSGTYPGTEDIDLENYREIFRKSHAIDIPSVRITYNKSDQELFWEFSKKHGPSPSKFQFQRNLIRRMPRVVAALYLKAMLLGRNYGVLRI